MILLSHILWGRDAFNFFSKKLEKFSCCMWVQRRYAFSEIFLLKKDNKKQCWIGCLTFSLTLSTTFHACHFITHDSEHTFNGSFTFCYLTWQANVAIHEQMSYTCHKNLALYEQVSYKCRTNVTICEQKPYVQCIWWFEKVGLLLWNFFLCER